MAPLLTLIAETAGVAVATILIEEALSFAIRRAVQLAGGSRTVIRDIKVSMRIIAALVIGSAILPITGLTSEFTTLTASGVAALAASLALQTTLTNIISGILLFSDGVIRLNDEIEYSGVKGKVVRVALRNTWIRESNGTLAVVSNSALSSGPLINHTAGSRLGKKFALD